MTEKKPITRMLGWWLGVLTMIAGLWFAVSPWVLNFTAETTPFYNAVVVGLLIAICGLFDAFGIGRLSLRSMRVFGTIAALLGLWAIAAPFVLGIVDGAARWNAILTGIVVLLVSGYDAWKMPSLAPMPQT
ncbi:MAG: SPW repeat protein [Chloroflexi bacterium]|nr:SPW repeat protein [Chloroflexota bacterium]